MGGKALQSALGRKSPHSLTDRGWCKGGGAGVEPLLHLEWGGVAAVDL